MAYPSLFNVFLGYFFKNLKINNIQSVPKKHNKPLK